MFEDGSAPLSFRIKDNANFRDGSIKVTITCRAEDIEITEIEFKEKYKEHLPLGFGEAKKKKISSHIDPGEIGRSRARSEQSEGKLC